MRYKDKFEISIIIPFYNSKKFIYKNLKSLKEQKTNVKFEILMINDGSNDGGEDIIKNFKELHIKKLTKSNNEGPSSARNLGIKKTNCKYIFFLDIDDTLESSAIEVLYNEIKKNNFDMIACDKKFIIKKNKRKDVFMYNTNKNFKKNDIKKLIVNRFKNSSQPVSMFDLTGKLFTKKLLIKNNILFEKKLRYLEDECFMWNAISKSKKIRYIKKQLYNYYINPNINTALSMAFIKNYNINNFFIVKKNIIKGLKNLKLSQIYLKKYSNHALIFFIISALISICKSILLKKVKKKEGTIILNKLIKNIFKEKKILKDIDKYKCSRDENKNIPRSLEIKDAKVLKKHLFIRTKEILSSRNIPT